MGYPCDGRSLVGNHQSNQSLLTGGVSKPRRPNFVSCRANGPYRRPRPTQSRNIEPKPIRRSVAALGASGSSHGPRVRSRRLSSHRNEMPRVPAGIHTDGPRVRRAAGRRGDPKAKQLHGMGRVDCRLGCPRRALKRHPSPPKAGIGFRLATRELADTHIQRVSNRRRIDLGCNASCSGGLLCCRHPEGIRPPG